LRIRKKNTGLRTFSGSVDRGRAPLDNAAMSLDSRGFPMPRFAIEDARRTATVTIAHDLGG
jgi:hypothetical protein